MWIVDYGTTWIKYYKLENNKAFQFISPPNPKLFLFLTEKLLIREGYKRNEALVIGFPGHVKKGRVFSAPELDEKSWLSYKLDKNLRKINIVPHILTNADLHGHLVVQRKGRELVLSMGPNLGSSLFIDGTLWPGTELGEHPFLKGKTYDMLLSNKALQKFGKKIWLKNMKLALAQLDETFNPDRIYITGTMSSLLENQKLPRHIIVAGQPTPSKKLLTVLQFSPPPRSGRKR
jgi:polyphosphate glucokinase